MDAIRAAQAPHHFLSVTKDGHSAIVSTTGNEDCHIILRGGKQPNYDAASVDAARARGWRKPGIPARIMIDFSHGNSSKRSARNRLRWAAMSRRRSAPATSAFSASWSRAISKPAGRILCPGKELVYGQSITDACIGWEDSRNLIDTLADAARERRVKAAADGESE